MRIDEAPGTATGSEQRLQGIGVSPGIAIGAAYIGDRGELPVNESRLDEPQIEAERGRFADAVSISVKQLRKLKTRAMALPGSAADEIGSVLDAHLAMLANSRLIRGVHRRIAKARINAERAIQLEIEEIGKTFAAMEDPYLAARIDDIRVVGARLIRNLLKKPYVPYSGLSGGAVILAEEVTPADTALMDPRRVGGFAAELGGANGHTAIMARALGLPAVLGIPELLDWARAEVPVIIDGTEGTVILEPAPETLRTYKARQQEDTRERRYLTRLRRLPATTRDDVEIRLEANVELPVEVEQELGLTFHPSPQDMVPVCDVVTINAPLHPETENLFDDELIGTMKRGAYLVNTARAKICDRDAIVRALNSGQLAGYAGDVWFPQPAPADHPWRTMPNHGMTPHVSGSSLSAQARYAAGTREILECWFDGKPIRDEYLIVQGGQLAGTGAHSYTAAAAR